MTPVVVSAEKGDAKRNFYVFPFSPFGLFSFFVFFKCGGELGKSEFFFFSCQLD